MKEFLEKIFSATVGFAFLGTLLFVVGATGIIPYSVPSQIIPTPVNMLISSVGVVLIIFSMWLAIQDVMLTRRSNSAHFSGITADEISNKVTDSLKVQFDELKVTGRIKYPLSCAPSLFEDRILHFHEEKELLADHFVHHLLNRCRSHIQNGMRVHLIIDSGTTLFSIFTRLGKESVKERRNSRGSWLDELFIETNNLRGVEMLMSVGRLDPSSRYSELALNCNLLPGAPLPVYSALTGRRTNDALKLLRDQARDAVFIALTTGNWIRLRRTAPVCPIPLARGHGHLEFKQAIFDNADEIFVVTPLGKIFVDTALSDVNIALGLSEDDPDPEKKPYYEVQVNNNKADFVKLISTSRKPHRLLSHHSTYVQSCLGVYDLDLDQILEKFKGATISEINHIFFPFDVLPNDQHMQMEIEFPHSGTRNEKFAQRFFHIPSVQ